MPKISKEVIEMYIIYRDIDELNNICENMTGDYYTDIAAFAKCWKKVKRRIKKLDVNTEEL